jgi:RNA polymerase sigma factor (TIGR02999 family)
VPTEVRGEVTRLIDAIAAGNQEARKQLFAQVYEELRAMAHGRIRAERPDHSWGATALVHEVYLHLMKGQHVFTRGRAYFFAAAASAMDQLLREHARRRAARPEGHLDPHGPVVLDRAAEAFEAAFQVNLLDLMDALDRLQVTGKDGERLHEVARLRIWGSLTYDDIAEDLGVSRATVERDWQIARAWLYGQLKGKDR